MFQWDRWLGLDTVISQMWALGTNTYLDWLRRLRKNKPQTFSRRMARCLMCSPYWRCPCGGWLKR
ncbi:hypothetical protein BDW59DRAFT_139010 [Aspergillus cavernicola]|uniref:Uncharacterized protein n=1 Tax=Aspergillus cavernicola TaxID=176166 RepID=A0ABR4IYZ1_9EURO